MSKIADTTGFLYATPSFVTGFGSLFDLFGFTDQFNESMEPSLADLRAIASDWQAVGEDLSDAIRKTAEQEQTATAAAGRR